MFEYFAKKLFGYEEAKASKKLRESYKAFLDGLISFPLNIPGTAFHACLKVRNYIYIYKYHKITRTFCKISQSPFMLTQRHCCIL